MSAETLNQTATLLCKDLFKKKYKRSFFFFKKLVEDPFDDYWDEVIGIAFSAVWQQAKWGDFMERLSIGSPHIHACNLNVLSVVIL